MPWRDTKTRFQGVFARHQESCRIDAGGDPKECNCAPGYYGVVWDRAARKHRKTRRFKGVMEARNARKDLLDALQQGTLVSVAGPRLTDARKQFIRGVGRSRLGAAARSRSARQASPRRRQPR